jgi:hypothetical protein
MKKFAPWALMAAAAATGAVLPWSPAHAADVGVSIGISQPGVYGRVDIGRFPQPQVVLQQPVIIGRPVAARPEPVYLWVPPAHRRDWRHHCGQYHACGVPVYFVQDRWYGEHVRPHAHDRDDRRDDRHDGRRDDDHGRGNGRGHDQ